MPYTHGQPKKRRGPHPVIGDMNRRVRGDRKAAGGGKGCAIVMVAMVGTAVAVIAALGYAAVVVLT